MASVRKGIAEILQDKGLVTPEQLAQARDVQKNAPGDLGRILVDLGFATDRDMVQSKAEAEGIPFIDLIKYQPEASAINVVPQNIVTKYNALPVRKDGQNLFVAMIDPRNVVAVDDIRMASRCNVRPMMAVPGDLEDAIAKAYAGSGGSGVTAVAPMQGGAGGGMAGGNLAALISEYGPVAGGDDDDRDGVAEADAAPIVRMANAIIVQAIGSGASDIHIEPDRRNLRVRCRIDGVLHEVMTIPKHIMAPLISRYKIMSDMNIAERRVPQDGRIPVRNEGKDYDMRVSCLPSLYGEKIVMRILDKSSVLLGLNKLGFTPDVQAQMEDMVIQPNGMFLVTGPTGSGKTTTLYSVLHKINSVEKNIITVEDPIEYQLGGITQVGVNKKAGLNFGNALRSFLRQDPDIIMVGEMRDLETAEIAIEAALTGHLVLSTLHTNDACSATIRLSDMGVEPFLISATVIGVLAQRLARKICMNCKEPYKIKAEELRRFGYPDATENPDAEVTLFKGRGCEICKGTGYKGRLGLYELMRMNEEIAELVVRRAPLGDIKEAARANGMKEMREDGLRKVLEGITTPQEVMRVVFTAGY